MSPRLSSFLQVAFSIGIGVLLIWLIYRGLSEEDKATVAMHFQTADYRWILFAMVFGMLSHLSRAWRWRYTLEPLGLKPDFVNSFGTVMIGYFANLALPRLGEATRCVVMARYEKMPFDKLFGTVIAERVADLVILLTITLTAFLLQFSQMDVLLNQDLQAAGLSERPVTLAQLFAEKAPGLGWLAVVGLLGLAGLWVFVRLLRRSSHPFALKVRKLLAGLGDGIKSVLTMKSKGLFIAHTLFIWLMYMAMFYVCFFALEGTKDVPVQGVLIAFVMGGFSIVLVQGGLGAYPAIMMLTLGLYGVNANEGLAFGWITWAAQTGLVIVLGLLSFLLLPLYNSRFRKIQP